jgi:formylglycine-generating enzyme required for sulfatase activity
MHEVRITRSFWMSVTEVTQKHWLAVMEHNPSEHQGEDLPVERVSWREANDFCGKLSTKEGRRYRLPTEAEWEYACRAGESGAFSGSRLVDDVGWCSLNSTSTKTVATLKPNSWGLFDMHGNVAEWCDDRFRPYPPDAATDSAGAGKGAARVVRGGSWKNFPAAARCAARSSAPDAYQFPHVGFRVVLEAE